MDANRTRKDGDRKFSINQNLTVCSVLRRTLKIMIDANLWKVHVHEQWSARVGLRVDLTSYNRPDATVKILISACLCVDTPFSALPPNDLTADEMLRQGISPTRLTRHTPRKKVGGGSPRNDIIDNSSGLPFFLLGVLEHIGELLVWKTC